jgi:hypothetical protein
MTESSTSSPQRAAKQRPASDTSTADHEESPEEALVEDLPPPPGGLDKFKQQRKPPHPDWVRACITGAVLLLLAGVIAVACWGWLSGWRTEDEIESFGLIMAPIVTLSGTILGFYFSTGPVDSG